MRRALPLFCLAVWLAACGGPSQPAPSAPAPIPLPVPPVFPVAPNAPPRVTVIIKTTCTELPCAVSVAANASDPDGDSLAYHWSGCASGSGPESVCTVTSPAPAVASVEVGDGHGHVVPASATAQGINRAPYVQLSSFYGFSDTSVSLEALGNIIDPDEGVLCGGGSGFGGSGCPYLESLEVSGDCRPTFSFTCYCLGGVELDVYRTAPSGTCTVTIKAKNRAGRVGTSIFTIPYRQGTGSPGW